MTSSAVLDELFGIAHRARQKALTRNERSVRVNTIQKY